MYIVYKIYFCNTEVPMRSSSQETLAKIALTLQRDSMNREKRKLNNSKEAGAEIWKRTRVSLDNMEVEVKKFKADEVARMKEIFPHLSINCIKVQLQEHCLFFYLHFLGKADIGKGQCHGCKRCLETGLQSDSNRGSKQCHRCR